MAKLNNNFLKGNISMKSLFDLTQLGNMTLKNRFVRAAVGEKTKDGKVNEHILGIYEKLAEGGAGTMITGFTLVDEAEKSFPMMAFYDNSFSQCHKKLTDLAHKYKANIILQLVYVGSYIMGDTNGASILAPSAVENLNTKVMPKEISLEQIKNIQVKFAEAALRAKNAGYDGVEIHAAHGFLLSQFMTPYYNIRTDLYGGSTQNRARMILETYEGMRKSVGHDYPIWIKINVSDGFDKGVSFDDVLYLCQELARRKIDAIETSGAFSKFPPEATSFFKNESKIIAEKIDRPVIMTGGNTNFHEMSEMLNNTKIGYFGIARGLIKEPGLIKQFEKQYK
jgi:2,4-dienoyl-CoA reductase-like NADH-dependent reductase (Old Yellow Enzyme family)